MLNPRGAATAPSGATAQTIRSRLIPWAVGFFGILTVGVALLVPAADNVWQQVLLAVVAAGSVLLTVRGSRLRLVYGEVGVTSHQLVRRATYPWSVIDRIGVADEIFIGARLADGRWVPLLHYRGLGDLSTTRAAEEVDRALGRHASMPLTSDGWHRRPPPPRWAILVMLVVCVVAVLVYSVTTNNWFPVVFFAVQVVLQRRYGDGAGRDFRPVGAGAHRDDAPTG